MAAGQTSGTGGTVSATLVYLIGWAIFLVLLIVAIVAGLWLGQHKR
jgi:hypothetical protein